MNQWVSVYDRFVNVQTIPVLSSATEADKILASNYGYTDEQLFGLGLRSERQCKSSSALGAGLTPMTLARRGRLLWTRIEAAIRRIKKTGILGGWKVSSWNAGNLSPLSRARGGMYVHAESKADAESKILLILPMLQTGCRPGRALTLDEISITFSDVMSAEDVDAHNLDVAGASVNEIEERIKQYEKSIADQRARLEEAKHARSQFIASVLLISSAEDDSVEEF